MPTGTIKSVKLKEKRQPPPELTVDDITGIAKQLSKEQGRYVSYGEVQAGIATGKIKVKKERGQWIMQN